MKRFKNIVISGMGLVFVLSGIAFAGDSAYDQAAGTSGDSWRAKQSADQGRYEDARREAGFGFDEPRTSNTPAPEVQRKIDSLPTPQPKIDKEYSK